MPEIAVHHGDCVAIMRELARGGTRVQAVVTDPPYELGFMGKKWDKSAVSFKARTWRRAFDLLAPGGHLLSFGGTRSWHRIGCAIEDAGFDIRDSVAWLYGTGLPKSHDMARAIDQELGVVGITVEIGEPPRLVRGEMFGPGQYIPASEEAWTWKDWGTGLKPACEPVIVARKPLAEPNPSSPTVAANVLAHGTGAINEDGCAVESEGDHLRSFVRGSSNGAVQIRGKKDFLPSQNPTGRHPANVVHDGGAEVREAFAAFGPAPGQLRPVRGDEPSSPAKNCYGEFGRAPSASPRGDAGDASRFFYSAKADRNDRWGSKHPTVKPIALMRWLVRLVTPPGGTVLDPFAGTGTTGVAALAEGFGAVLIEQEAEHVADIQERLAFYRGEGRHWLEREAERDPAKAAGEDLPLFQETEIRDQTTDGAGER